MPESVRILRAAVKHAAGSDAKCLLICSTGPKEGRSMIASGLALAFAETQDRVLLIDADMRSAHIRSRLRVDSVNGLSDVLTARVSIDKAIAKVNNHLDVICSTSSFVENPSALLESTAMYALLDSLRPKYDRILVDAPNANNFADACAVSAACDACVLVARYEKTFGAVKQPLCLFCLVQVIRKKPCRICSMAFFLLQHLSLYFNRSGSP